MFPQADSTNHRCTWYHLAVIGNASFDRGLWARSLAEGWS